MRLIHAFALLGIVTLGPLANPGCTKYGEGSPCAIENTDPVTHISNDCEDGLVCTPAGMLQACNDSPICCPPQGQTVTSPACIAGTTPDCSTGGSGGMNSNNVGGFGGSGGKIPCAHDLCLAGDRLLPACDPCVPTVCATDPTCCEHAWDDICVSRAVSLCKGLECNASGGGGTGGTGGTAGHGGMSSGGNGGNGGTGGTGGTGGH
jgi:hypothetical protein